MRLIALDGATRTGYSIWDIRSERVVLEQYGAIQLKVKKQEPKDYIRIQDMDNFLDLIIKQSDFIIFEDVFGGLNFNTTKFLIKMQHFLQSYFIRNRIDFADQYL